MLTVPTSRFATTRVESSGEIATADPRVEPTAGVVHAEGPPPAPPAPEDELDEDDDSDEPEDDDDEDDDDDDDELELVVVVVLVSGSSPQPGAARAAMPESASAPVETNIPARRGVLVLPTILMVCSSSCARQRSSPRAP